MVHAGRDWRDWTEAGELSRKCEHDAWLHEQLGARSSRFPWGSVESVYDPKALCSNIVVRYAPTSARGKAMNIAELGTLLAAEGYDPGFYSLGGRLPAYEGLILRKTGANWTIEHFERGVRRALELLPTEDEACRRMHTLMSEQFR